MLTGYNVGMWNLKEEHVVPGIVVELSPFSFFCFFTGVRFLSPFSQFSLE